MDPLDAVVREAVLQLFAAAAAAPNAAAFPPAAWDAFGVAEAAAPPHVLEDARSALAEALFAAYSTGLDPSLVAASASPAGAAYASARVRDRVAAAILHNDDAGEEGPMLLLHLPDDVLVYLVNRLRSDE